MNFQGPLRIFYNGENGINGKNQRNKGTPLLLRDGKDGDNGPHGTNASSSDDYIAQMESDLQMQEQSEKRQADD